MAARPERLPRPLLARMLCRCSLLLTLHATAAMTNPAFRAGAACFAAGELPEARRHFEESLLIDPDDAATKAVLSKLDALGVDSSATDEHRYAEYTLQLGGGRPMIKILRPLGLGCEAGDSSGLEVWTCSLAMLKWLCEEGSDRPEIEGRRVLELGAGAHGVVGNAIAALGARHVCLTDLPHMMVPLRANMLANKARPPDRPPGPTVAVAPLVWGQTSGPLFDERHPASSWDLIVASDVCYDGGLIEPLAATLRALLAANPKATALLALSNLDHLAGAGTPNYAPLLDHLDTFVHRRVASLAGEQIVARVEADGESPLPIADRHRDHMIDIFTIGHG